MALPSLQDISAGLQQFKELLILQARQAMLSAIASGDIGLQQQIAASLQQILAFRPAAHGFHGDVTRPTLFLAGEAGQRERVDITPQPQQDRVLAPSVVNNSPSVEVNVEQHFEGSANPAVVKEAAQEGVKVGLRQYMRLRGAVL